MAEQERIFPDPGAKPGEYSLDWRRGNRRFSGEVELGPRRFPQFNLYGKLRRRRPDAAGGIGFPGPEITFDRLVGRLRSNEDVVIIDATLSEWFPERFRGYGQWAVMGLGVADIPEDRYTRVSFQITEADLWFGRAPVAEVTVPHLGSGTPTYSATLNESAHRIWRDTRNGMSIDIGYWNTSSLNPYRVGVTFAPVFDIASRHPLSLDEWAKEWIAPLVDLASFATKHSQTLSWLSVNFGSGRERVTGTVFSGGIHQAPYTAQDDRRARLERPPLFYLGELPMSATKLVRRWRELQASDDPFVELYRAALFQTDLPARARYLQLIQALEARHSYANRQEDEAEQAQFEVKRTETIDAAREAGLSASSLQFLKKKWGIRRPDSLDRRLRALLDDLPANTRQGIESSAELDAIRSQLISEKSATTLPEQLRALRNQLSHGDRNYPDHELAPWVSALETICRAQLLALLGFPRSAIQGALDAAT